MTREHRIPADRPAHLVVLISGGGRTLVNLHRSIESGAIPARIDRVIASRECPGAALARGMGYNTAIEPGVIPRARLESLLHGADIAVLAGYLKHVQIPPGWAGRILNIHPALLPQFGGAGMYGERVHRAVLASGARESGCTVHVVDDRFDEGPIVLQKRCPVIEGDTPASLAARVFELECQAYPEALARIIESMREKP